MTRAIRILCLSALVVGLIRLEAQSGEQGVKPSADKLTREQEAILRKAGVIDDPEALLRFFRLRSAQRLFDFAKQLGSEDFQVRETASRELTNAGVASLFILQTGVKDSHGRIWRAIKDPDPELSHRAKTCVEEITNSLEGQLWVHRAASHLLLKKRPEGAIEALTGYLPTVEDKEFRRELQSGLAAISVRNGTINIVLIEQLRAKAMFQRIGAASVLGQLGQECTPAAARLLLEANLNEQEGMVQGAFHQALNELGPAALPVYLEALKDKRPAMRRQGVSIGRYKDHSKIVVPALTKACGDSDPHVRLWAIYSRVVFRRSGPDCTRDDQDFGRQCCSQGPSRPASLSSGSGSSSGIRS